MYGDVYTAVDKHCFGWFCDSCWTFDQWWSVFLNRSSADSGQGVCAKMGELVYSILIQHNGLKRHRIKVCHSKTIGMPRSKMDEGPTQSMGWWTTNSGSFDTNKPIIRWGHTCSGKGMVLESGDILSAVIKIKFATFVLRFPGLWGLQKDPVKTETRTENSGNHFSIYVTYYVGAHLYKE